MQAHTLSSLDVSFFSQIDFEEKENRMGKLDKPMRKTTQKRPTTHDKKKRKIGDMSLDVL